MSGEPKITNEIACLSSNYLMNTYGERTISIVRGEGTKVWDSAGKEYLDLIAGIAVSTLGHCHPEVVDAIREQAGILIHASNLYNVGPQAELGKKLIENSFADKVFFCNSGAEANEAAIKLSRKFGSGKYEIIVMEGSFHGRTIATITATGQEKIKKGFAPFLPGFKHVPFNDLDAVEKAIGNETIAVMVEPVQGESGIRAAEAEFIAGLRRLCDERKMLLILDEIQCGLGRTGKLFAYEHYGIEPDIMTLAKPIGGGLPLGAALATGRVSEVFTPGSHASTFGGNPVACSAGIATLEVILKENLVERAETTGKYLFEKLCRLKEKHKLVSDVRGKGLMAGIELNIPCQEIVKECAMRGVLLNCTAETVIRFLPPLIVTEEEIDAGLRVLDEVLNEPNFHS
jgi:predicted acetylornithine/succinylornithine family transaminase